MADTPFQESTKQYHFSDSSNSPKRVKRLIILVFFIAITGGLIFGVSQFVGKSDTENKEEPLTPTPTDFVFPTDTPVPTEAKQKTTPTQKPSSTITPRPTTNPKDKATGLDRSTLSLEVQNGSGVVGAASKASDLLKSFGYNVIRTGNADNFDYDKTIIQIKSDKTSFLSLLKKDLEGSYVIGSASASLSASASADAIVIVGKE